MALRTRSQKMAEEIYRQVRLVEDGQKDDYGNACMKLAPLVLSDGLMQTVAFYEVKAKKKAGFMAFLRDLQECVQPGGDAGGSLHEWLLHCENGVAYMSMTRRVLDAAVWYKRFAESLLDADSAASNE